MKPIVFIDWHGVLSNKLFWHSFDEGSAKEQYLRTRLNDEIFGEKQVLKMDGSQTSEEFVQSVSETLDEPYNIMWYRFVEDCKTFGFESLSYVDQIEQLRQVAKVVLATDQGEGFRRFVLPCNQIADHFDDMLISDQVGTVKNDAKIFFDPYLNEISSGKALLIDDSDHACKPFTELGGSVIQVTDFVSTTKALSDALKWARAQNYGK